MQKFKWGIIGTGMIAHKMADALLLLENAEISAVLSRKTETAEMFSREYNIPHIFTDLEGFASSNVVDIAYVATPHNKHRNEARACLANGKPVLCEKPMGVNHAEVEELTAMARGSGLLLAEAFWTFYYPAMQNALALVEEGAIGQPKMIDARFCFLREVDPANRKFNPDLAGGALLDIGLYCLAFAQKVFNAQPVSVKGSAIIGPTGVDESSAYILTYEGGRMATLSSSFRAVTHNDAWIFGEKGSIKIPMFWQPDEFTLIKNGKEKRYTFDRLGNGYTYEAMAFMNLLVENQKESHVFSLQDSLDLIKIMDMLRKQWGLQYPFER
jgi:dihydrodiol dehydrogenase / D-xylose 1-dehydrogenase (NADP)